MSASRSPGLRPQDLDADQQALYDAIVGGPRGAGPQAFPMTDPEGRLHGPFDAMLLAPALGTALQAVGAAIRFGGSLSARERELAVLAVAGAWDSEFELYAHRAIGAQVGLSEEFLSAAAVGDATPFDDDRERAVVATASTLARAGDLDDAAYAAAVGVLGETVVYELVTLAGYYAALGLALRVYRVDPPA